MKRISPLALVTLVLLLSCGDDDPAGPPDDGGNNNNPEPQATAPGTPNGPASNLTIGAAGGTLASDDGNFSIDIPAGALSSDTEIIIQPITNTAWGGVGNGYRLEPDGLTFAIPVELTFDVAPETLEGSHPDFLDVAVQNDEGFWYILKNRNYDEIAGTLTASTTHFSDYSNVEGLQIRPASATVETNGVVNLEVQYCYQEVFDDDEDMLAALVYTCDGELAPLGTFENWSVNGIPGGDANVGTVVELANGTARYTAPASVPQNNPVAVSVQAQGVSSSQTLVCNVTIGSKWYGTATVDFGGGEKITAYVVWKSAYTYQTLEAFAPESGTMTYAPNTHFDPPCWFVSFGPSTGDILPDDGQLFIDHTTSPGRFYGTGSSALLATYCFSCDGWDEPDCQESLYFLTWMVAVEEDGWELDDENTISHAWADLSGPDPVGYAIEFTRGVPPAPLRAFASQ